MPIISPNMLKTFEQCQKKYKLKYIENIDLIQNSLFFEKGKKIHALANYFLNNQDITKLENTLNEQEMEDWLKLKNNKYFSMNVINTEYNISCKIGEYWIGGRLDALVQKDKDFYILDYKTGKIPANTETDFQTITYLLCADKLIKKIFEKYNSLNFVYIGLKENTKKIIKFDTEKQKIYEEKILKTCDSIKLKVFAKNTTNCINCEYFKLCN